MRIRIVVRGYRVKQILAMRGRTVKWLAGKAGASDTHMYLVVGNSSNVSPGMANRIAKVMAPTPWDELFQIRECTVTTGGMDG